MTLAHFIRLVGCLLGIVYAAPLYANSERPPSVAPVYRVIGEDSLRAFVFLPPERDLGRVADDDEILALLRRIGGLDDRGVELAFTVISNHLSVSRSPRPSSSSADDRPDTSTPRRGSASSRPRS